jgi:hypothetical protein
MISLTHNGQDFGHRMNTRAGQVAPSFMWSKFDQILNDEIQPLWVAILMWKDVQIRLTVIRPTFPVSVFEAPGSLGCEKPAQLMRRSDPTSGWEYAEVDSRAVAIKRLNGYDSQKVSAPFLDQSNLNLAYTYSEQPMIYESQASVAARCLASAALLRPMPFEPAYEFDGIKVEVEYPEFFRINLPDTRSALVAPGETTPRRITINGIEVEGDQLRYIQVTKDRNEISGLGITHVAGIVSFSGPATFSLKRAADGAIHVATNVGISLTDNWSRGQDHKVEAQTLDHCWVDVTALCQKGSIPLEVVQEWSDRNQRTLVDFRINV